MSITIVSHVYAEKFPQYAAFLRAQIQSLFLHKAECPVLLRVFYNGGDAAVQDVITDIELGEFGRFRPGLNLQYTPLSPGELFRRAIGRNRAALESRTELVWFTDVDHYFGKDCLSSLWWTWNGIQRAPKVEHPISMIYPRTVWVDPDFARADFCWQFLLNGGELTPDTFENFVAKHYNRAIGGVQVVPGGLAQKYGYLDGTAYQNPSDPARGPFPDFKDDVAFRRAIGRHGRTVPVDVPNLYRLRHTAVTYK